MTLGLGIMLGLLFISIGICLSVGLYVSYLQDMRVHGSKDKN